MKNNITFLIFISVIIIATGLLIRAENQINTQKVKLSGLEQTIKKNNEKITALRKVNSSQSAQIIALESLPTPTPVIKYRTNTVTKTQ